MAALNRPSRWGVALRGLAAIAFGILAWSWPGMTLMVLLVLFGVYAIVDGIFAIAAGVGGETRRRWLAVLVGIASIILGILAFTRPGLTALILLMFIAARALVVGALDIATAFSFRKELRGMWLLALSGILSLIFGFAMIAYPFAGALAVLWVIGLYAILVGLAELAFAIFARSAREELAAPGAAPMPA